MNDNTPFLMLEQPCDVAVALLADRVSQAGMSVMRTFDLQVARHAQMACPCPHHGTDRCDCQMVVLLVYKIDQGPITIIAHGYNGQTWFSVVNTPQQRADPQLEATIRHLVESPLLCSIELENNAHPV